jgi:hypothetical protein
MCISGMYDLTLVRLSARSRYVAFDDATVAALSPMDRYRLLPPDLERARLARASPDFSYRVGFRVAVTRRTTEPMTRVRGCGLK